MLWRKRRFISSCPLGPRRGLNPTSRADWLLDCSITTSSSVAGPATLVPSRALDMHLMINTSHKVTQGPFGAPRRECPSPPFLFYPFPRPPRAKHVDRPWPHSVPSKRPLHKRHSTACTASLQGTHRRTTRWAPPERRGGIAPA